jgi:bacterioferritin-associated ferredoxin
MKSNDDLIICRCECVSFGKIKSSIQHSGAQTVNQVKKLTRAGMGMCQGRTCAKVVESILTAEGNSPPGIEPYQARPPVRGLPIATLADTADQFEEPAGPVRVDLSRETDRSSEP